MRLEDYGWDPFFAEQWHEDQEKGHTIGRISSEHKNQYTVLTVQGEMPAVPTGKMYHDAMERHDLPVVGDWVAIDIVNDTPPLAVIHCVLPRRSMFSRKEAGKRVREQPVAANVDTIFIVVGLDANFNVRRIERYLALAWESGAEPVILLSKSDLRDDLSTIMDDVATVAVGVPVHPVSSLDGQGLEELDDYLAPGRTVALLGSSGVGKSTLLNHWLGGEFQRVQDVRADDSRGRHTTTHRQLFMLPCGALVIDTPGMRELQLWDAGDGLAEAFDDIEALASECRYSDCQHEHEPGCAVKRALCDGTLESGRYDNYRKMQREVRYLETKLDRQAELARKHAWKQITKQIREIEKNR